jgi:hypothetical protein
VAHPQAFDHEVWAIFWYILNDLSQSESIVQPVRQIVLRVKGASIESGEGVATFRDLILSIHELADNCSVGFRDQLPRIAPSSTREVEDQNEAQQWDTLDQIIQAAEKLSSSKGRNERFRRKKARDLIAIVAAWVLKIVTQYGWALTTHEMVAAIVPIAN